MHIKNNNNIICILHYPYRTQTRIAKKERITKIWTSSPLDRSGRHGAYTQQQRQQNTHFKH